MAEKTHDSVLAAPVAAEPHPLLDSEQVSIHSRERGESAQAMNARRSGAAALLTTPFPDRVRHLWRYTDPQRLVPQQLLDPAAATVTAAVPADLLASFDALDAAGKPAILVWPGQPPQLSAAARDSGLAVVSLAGDAPVGERLGQAVPAEHGWFEALNLAAWAVGVAIEAPAGLILAEPVRVLVPAVAGQDLLPRLLLVAGRGASLTLVEEHLGGGADGLVVGVTEVLVDAGAEVRHVLVQRWHDGQRGHLTQRARLDRDARYHGAIASLGGSLAKLDLGAILAGPGARSELVGVTLPRGRQRLDHHTLHRHTAGHTWSNIDFKAAVFDRARSAYTGLIRIEKNAPVSEAYQENRNLLMTDRARVDTIPELEILTDEVSCSHGATVAPLDPEHIFYLQSRGLPRDQALRHIVRGFVEPTLRLVPEGLREELEVLIEARLDGLRLGA